jgi:hypothetical protein
MKASLLLLLMLLSGCSLMNRFESAPDLLAGMCWKQMQQPGTLDALFNTPQGKCAAWIVCRKVGVILDYGAQYCQQTGMRGVE